MAGTEVRNPDGTFAAGNVSNPEGKNGHLPGWQRYGDRLQKWLNMPVTELLALAGDEKRKAELSTIDAICVQHVANSIAGKNILPERKELIDRIEGTPKQTISGDKDNPLTFTLKFNAGTDLPKADPLSKAE
jgi:hypothetical protein